MLESTPKQTKEGSKSCGYLENSSVGRRNCTQNSPEGEHHARHRGNK